MKLSPALIYRELNQVYTTTAGGALSTKPTLKRPMLLGMDVKPNPGALCILAPDHVRAASAHPSALLVTVGKGSASPGQWVVDAPSLGDVYNQIQNIFDRYEAWYTELVESRLQGQSISGEALAGFLGDEAAADCAGKHGQAMEAALNAALGHALAKP